MVKRSLGFFFFLLIVLASRTKVSPAADVEDSVAAASARSFANASLPLAHILRIFS
ncbi:hypothetical protein J1N35_016762 [Gossypium stocksii]|uniref:Uncharacterized protein n=1 Tax=Gossypium stocksii TaxID=47602 RepID=A0A9D3VM88_9ROSI|nr:hypothetical protein J1N35_016762 [Gossypium stocksii]